MNLVTFPQANIVFRKPEGWDESQCSDVAAFQGQIGEGTLDGMEVVIVAWQPTPAEIQEIVNGHPIYLMVCGSGLPPHSLMTKFPQ